MPYPVELWPEEISLSNYVYLFQKNPIGRWTWNSVVISVGTSLLQAALCSMAAYGFGRTHFRGRKTLLSLTMLLLVIPIQTRILPLFIIFSEVKLLNTYWAWLRSSRMRLAFTCLCSTCRPFPWTLTRPPELTEPAFCAPIGM